MSAETDPAQNGDAATSVRALLGKLDTELRTRTEVDISVEGTFANVLKGCFLKAYEFARLAHGSLEPGVAFFVAPSLRGICEDFIALRFLHQKRSGRECDELLTAKAMNQLATAAEKQVAFFKRARPYQPVFALKEGTVFPPAGLPPARNMASEVGLDDLYDFVYAIASDVVHFNPRIIIRNAWGDHPKFSHSASNFDRYYQEFCRVYSLYFLVMFARAFANEVGLSEEFLADIKLLNDCLEEEVRWPEAVTYEEMNMKPPGYLTRMLLRAAHRVVGGDRENQGDGSELSE